MGSGIKYLVAFVLGKLSKYRRFNSSDSATKRTYVKNERKNLGIIRKTERRRIQTLNAAKNYR